MRTKNVEVVKDRWTDGLALEISHKYSIGHTTLNNYLRRLNIPRHR